MAVIGLGNMGSEIAIRLSAAHDIVGFDTDAARRADIGRRSPVQPVEALADVAVADVVILSLPTRAASLAVVRELAGLLASGSTIVETSTVNPDDVRRLNEICAGSGIALVDAAILAGVLQMRQGQAAVMASGRPGALDRVAPLIDMMSAEWSRVGDLGNAMALKVIHNAVIHAVMVVLVEAVAMAESTGADSRKLVEILKDPDRGLLRPLTHRVAERILGGSLEGGMPTEAALKDSTLALELAQAGNVPLFAIQSSHTVYEAAVAKGLGRLDYAAISKLWEDWRGFNFAHEDR